MDRLLRVEPALRSGQVPRIVVLTEHICFWSLVFRACILDQAQDGGSSRQGTKARRRSRRFWRAQRTARQVLNTRQIGAVERREASSCVPWPSATLIDSLRAGLTFNGVREVLHSFIQIRNANVVKGSLEHSHADQTVAKHPILQVNHIVRAWIPGNAVGCELRQNSPALCFQVNAYELGIFLLSRGASPAAQDHDGRTTIHYMAEFQWGLEDHLADVIKALKRMPSTALPSGPSGGNGGPLRTGALTRARRRTSRRGCEAPWLTPARTSLRATTRATPRLRSTPWRRGAC